MNSMTSKRVDRSRFEPGLRNVKVTMRFLRLTRRRFEIATLKTYGARYFKEVVAPGVAWLWAFQGVFQTCGSMGSR